MEDIAILSKLNSKKRLDAIISHPKPMELMKTLSPALLWQTIYEVGKEDAIELFELLPPKMVRNILDFEIWHNDRLNPKKMGEFLCLLFEANRDIAVKQIQKLDVELIGLFFKMSSEIYDTSLGEEPLDLGNFYSTSPDNRFIVVFKQSSEYALLVHGLHQYLNALYERDMSFALRLLESIRFELASQLEEEALKWRNIRLSEMGILPKEERFRFFSRLNNLDKKSLPYNSLVNNLLINTDQLTIFEDKNICPKQLAYIVQNMHMDLSGNFGDMDEIKNSTKYIKMLLDIGLLKSAHDLKKSTLEILKDYSLEDLIRLGRTNIVNLKSLVLAIAKDKNHLVGENFILLDSPLCEVARGLLEKEPLYYEGLLDVKKVTYRFFMDPKEVNATLMAVGELKFRSLLMGPLGVGFTLENLPDDKETHASLMTQVLKNNTDHKKYAQELANKTNLPLDRIENFINVAKTFTT